MPIDPNIILGIKPVQLQQQDPMDQYGKSVALKNLMLQSDAAQRGIEDENTQRDALIASGGDNKRYRELLANRGQYKAVQGLDKFNLEAEDKRATIDRNKQEILIKATAAHRDQLANINDPKSAAQWVMAGYQDPVIGPVLSKALSIEQAIARIPQDPQEFQQWKNQAALGATKYIEANKPHITTQDVGGSSNIVSTPGLGGAPSVLSTTAKTQTPESVASNATAQRGQNMTDRRQREANAVAAVTAGLKQKELEGATADKNAAKEQAMASYDTAIATLDRMVGRGKAGDKGYQAAHPGFEAAVGAGIQKTLMPLLPPTPGTSRAGFMRELETFKAQTFLPMVQQLKGMGALSDAEGAKLSAAVGALHEDMPEDEFKASVALIRKDLQAAKERASHGRQPVSGQPKPSKPAGVDPSKLSDDELKRELGL